MKTQEFKVGDYVQWVGGCICEVVSVRKLNSPDYTAGRLRHSKFCSHKGCGGVREGTSYTLTHFVTKIAPFEAFVFRTLEEGQV